MRRTQTWRQFDFLVLGTVLVLVALGVAMIRSANLGTPDLADLWRRQATFAAIGLALFLLVAIIPYSWFRHVWWLGYLLALGLLILVLFLGESEIGDVRRWFYIGDFRFQPSFPAMLLHVVAMAALLDRRPRRERRLRMEGEVFQERPGLGTYILSGGMALALAGLVFLEPDLSTAAVFLVVWAVAAFVSGVRLAYLLTTGLVGLAALVPMWEVMKPYQRDRLLTFLNPARDPGALYNMRQALISIGSGGVWGQGYGVGNQSQLHFLRVRHTDFVFSVVGEELGFIGTMLVLSLFALLAWRLLRAAVLAPDRFGRLLVVGAGAVVFFPLIVNVGMNIGLLPVTGLPLPFISYGGTALLTSMTALGLVTGVVMRRKGK
ncbi:MAG TPA: rod shape-determining protein RodA [Anaerolineales bacterium]|nr:rod shape-determining protein RodA [Anaerolineae bacterium]HIQ02369.1 rod shape-determining protein RodA [Anaerolineales bacterium]